MDACSSRRDVDLLLGKQSDDADMDTMLADQYERVKKLQEMAINRGSDPNRDKDYGHGSRFSVSVTDDAGISSHQLAASTDQDKHRKLPNQFVDTQAKVADGDDDGDDDDGDDVHTSDDGFVVPDNDPLIYDSDPDELMIFDDTDGSGEGLLASEETGRQPRKGHKRKLEKVSKRKRKKKRVKTSDALQISRGVVAPLDSWPQYGNALEKFKEMIRDFFGNSVAPSEEIICLLRDFAETVPFFFMLAHETTCSDVLDLDDEAMSGARAVVENWNTALTTFIQDLLQVAVDQNDALKRKHASANVIRMLEQCYHLEWTSFNINARGHRCSFTGEALELGEEAYAVRATAKNHTNDFYISLCPGVPALYMQQLLAYYHFRWARSVFVCDIRSWQNESARGNMAAFLSAENTSFIARTIAKYAINKFVVRTMMRPPPR